MESLVLRAVLAECRELTGAVVESIEFFPGSPRWLLVFAAGAIMIDLAGTGPAIYRTNTARREQGDPRGGSDGADRSRRPSDRERDRNRRPRPGLAGTLEDRLTGARAVQFEQSGLNRMAMLSFEKRDRFGDPVTTRLIVELFGSWGNLIVVDGGPDGNRILDRLRPDRRRDGARALERGNLYEMPGRKRVDLVVDGPDAVVNRLEASPPPATADEWQRRFEESVEGAGSSAAADVLQRTGAPLSGRTLVETWTTLVAKASSPGEAWLVLPAGQQRPRVMVHLPLEVPGQAVVSYPGASAAVEASRSPALVSESRVPEGPWLELSRLIEARREKSARLVSRLKAELDRRPDGELDRLRAETLLANAGRIESGRSEVVLASPRGDGELTVPLDPSVSITENARRYYREARKAELAAAELPKKIESAAAHVARAAAWLAQLKELKVTDEAGIETLRAEVEGRRLPSRPAPGSADLRRGRKSEGAEDRDADSSRGSPSRDRTPASMQPRRYDLPGGWVLLVGRSQAGNDYLTHRLAAPHDLWFHVHGASGSHVILKAPDRKAQPDKSVILAAAALAALNSKARHASRVPVIYTEKRHVRKPRGSRPGLAAVTDEKSVMVRPGEPPGAAGRDIS